MAPTVESGRSTSMKAGGPSARSMMTSVTFHAVALIALLLIPAGALGRSIRPKRVDVVFYRPRPLIEVPTHTVRPPLPGGAPGAGPRPGPLAPPKPRPNAPAGPLAPGNPELPPGPDVPMA